MRKTFVTGFAFAVAACVAAAAHAQAYRWTDKDGHVQYGDAPPPGVRATPIALPASPAPSAGAKPPLTPAQEEQQFRKRQLEKQKAEEKTAQEREQAEAKKQNCASAQESLRVLQSGQRVARVDAKGERYYLDDAQRAQETARAQEAVKQWCD